MSAAAPASGLLSSFPSPPDSVLLRDPSSDSTQTRARTRIHTPALTLTRLPLSVTPHPVPCPFPSHTHLFNHFAALLQRILLSCATHPPPAPPFLSPPPSPPRPVSPPLLTLCLQPGPDGAAPCHGQSAGRVSGESIFFRARPRDPDRANVCTLLCRRRGRGWPVLSSSSSVFSHRFPPCHTPPPSRPRVCLWYVSPCMPCVMIMSVVVYGPKPLGPPSVFSRFDFTSIVTLSSLPRRASCLLSPGWIPE